ncbi:MAG: hypothetical protein D6795_15730 [Deltaproteobacteria bacterium]|nr:MAG: hypothetical protein D6795_15730 [Deltaproteobacteria bacterium]
MPSPGSRYRISLLLLIHLCALRGWLAGVEVQAGEDGGAPLRSLRHEVPGEVVLGTPVTLSFEVPEGWRLSDLYFRVPEVSETFSRLSLTAVGAGRYEVTIPGYEVIGKRLEYYVVGERDDGTPFDSRGEGCFSTVISPVEKHSPPPAFVAAGQRGEDLPPLIRPWYEDLHKKWWAWGIAAGVVASGVGAYLLLQGDRVVFIEQEVTPRDPEPAAIFIPFPPRE